MGRCGAGCRRGGAQRGDEARGDDGGFQRSRIPQIKGVQGPEEEVYVHAVCSLVVGNVATVWFKKYLYILKLVYRCFQCVSGFKMYRYFLNHTVVAVVSDYSEKACYVPQSPPHFYI